MLAEIVESAGYAMVRNVLGVDRIGGLIESLREEANASIGRGGRRNLLNEPTVRQLANSTEIRKLVEPILGENAFVVRGILFDKTEGSNWKVPWHQDVTIAIKDRVDIDGFGPWSIKQGVQHVQPPHVCIAKNDIRSHSSG
jgi:hypothetical protein